MSHIALNRGLKVLNYLVEHKSARFKDLAKLLDPISPASLMRLLRTLVNLGEVKKENNQYRLSSSSVFHTASDTHPFALTAEAGSELDSVVRKLARETSYPAALFCWVTPGNMIILHSYSPIGSDMQYRPAGEEWPLIPFHDYAQLFLAYAPGYLREDAFFRWNPYLNDDYRSRDFQAFISRLNRIRKQGFTVSEEVMKTVGSVVYPVFLHEEEMPRFAVGTLVNGKPGKETTSDLKIVLKKAAGDLSGILKESISKKQLTLDLSRSQRIVQEYMDPLE